MKKLTRPRLLVGCANECADIEYATGFRAVDPVVFLEKGYKRYLVVPRFELGRARGGRTGVEVVAPEELGLGCLKRRELGECALKLLKKLNVNRVSVPLFFPHGVARRLERAGIHVVVSRGDLFPERAVKSNDELRKIRESQQAAVIAMRAAVAMITHSEIDSGGDLKFRGKHLTSGDVRRSVANVLIEHDCWCGETIVAGGRQAADPHEAGEGPLRAHEAIVIDIFPRHMIHGYWGDLTRTVVKGVPSPSLKKMYYAVKAAQAAALNRVKPGVKCASVHQAAVEELTRRGFKTSTAGTKGVGFIHSTGHGVGLAIHEAPSVGAGEGRLRNGNVITVEPGLYNPDIGGVRIEDTVVVVSRGWRYLVPCEKKFEV